MALKTLARKGLGGHPILTLDKVEQPPEHRSPLPRIEQKTHTAEPPQNQDFEAALWAQRNEWDIRRRSLPKDATDWLRSGGFAGRGKLSKHDASRLLAMGMAALEGAPNSLAKHRQGGVR